MSDTHSTAGMAVIKLSSTGIVTGWNGEAEQLTGYNSSEIVGKEFGTLHSIENVRRKRPAELLKSAIADGEVTYQDWHVRKDGSHFWASLHLAAIHDSRGVLSGYLIEMRAASQTNQVAEKFRARNAELEKQLGERTAELGERTAQLGVRTDELGSQTAQLGERTTQLSAKTKDFNSSEARNVSLEGQLDERTAQLGVRTEQLGVRTNELGSQTAQLGERTTQLSAKTKEFNTSEALNSTLEGQLGERTAQLGERTAQLGVRTDELGVRTGELGERTAQLGVRTEQLSVRTDELGSQTTQLGERTNQLSAKTKAFNTSEALNASLEGQLGERTAQLGERTAQLGVRTDELGIRTGELGERTAQLGVRTDELGVRTGELGERTAQLGVRTDELGSQTTELGERTFQLSAKTKEFNTVEALNKELEAFTYAASHDLRAPLRSIDGFSLALLEDYADKPLDEVGQSHLKRIRACAQRMGQLIDDLIGLSSLTRGSLKRSACDLTVEGRKIATELKLTKPDRDVTFDFTNQLPTNCDVHLMRIVLVNLLGNAFKYTSKLKTAKIEMGCKASKDGTVYFVRDNGAGFPDMRLRRLPLPA